MSLQRMLSGDPARSSTLYLAIGVLSLVKAIAVRNDSQRFRRELLDAGLFIGVGLVLRRYSQLKAEKRDELRESVPDWLLSEPATGSGGLAQVAKRQLGGEPEPEPTIQERVKQAVGNRS